MIKNFIYLQRINMSNIRQTFIIKNFGEELLKKKIS